MNTVILFFFSFLLLFLSFSVELIPFLPFSKGPSAFISASFLVISTQWFSGNGL